MNKLKLIKLVHTVVWVLMASMVVYFFFCALSGLTNIFTWISGAVILLEGLVLLCFRGNCPLRLLAAKETDSREDGFDIYLPAWLARHTVTIFSSLFIFALVVLLIRII
jgi:hypothetical protein